MIIEPPKDLDESSLDNYIERIMYYEKLYDEMMHYILFTKELTREDRHYLFEELDNIQKHLNKIKNVKY